MTRRRVAHPYGMSPALDRALYQKQVEARARGERIAVSAVTADVGNVAAGLPPKDHAFIKGNPIDVEDWSMLTLTFSDGTKSTILRQAT